MALRPRIYYNAEQKAEMWDRWQRGVTFCGCAVICFTASLALVALAAFCRCYQGTKLAIWCEHAMEPGQVNSGLRHQGGKPSHEIQRLEDDVGSAISIRRL